MMSSGGKVSVGEKVSIARNAQSPPWSQADLAREVGFRSKSKIAMWELNRTKYPHKDDIAKVAEVLKIPVDWFYDGRPGAPPKLDQGITVHRADSISEGFSITAAIRSFRGALAGLASWALEAVGELWHPAKTKTKRRPANLREAMFTL